jgi:hypothetical protein
LDSIPLDTSRVQFIKDRECAERLAPLRRQNNAAKVVCGSKGELGEILPTPESVDRKEVRPMTIFGKKDNSQVQVPEIEVRGDEVRVQETDSGQEGEQKPQDRSYKLPKTKWF